MWPYASSCQGTKELKNTNCSPYYTLNMKFLSLRQNSFCLVKRGYRGEREVVVRRKGRGRARRDN
jgi:hypothetical protein